MEDVVPERQPGPENKPTEDATDTGYMLIDHEEVIIRQLRNIRQELSTQIAGVRRELEIQWEVLSRLLLFMAPIAITWAVTMFVRLAGNRTWEGYAAAVSCGVILSVLVFDLHGLLDAVLNYIWARQYHENPKAANIQPVWTRSEEYATDGQDKETNTDYLVEPTLEDIPVEELPLPD
ncbi:uncharacterized protein LOC132543866 [Ylistrum balloti]|uniref:uncharacterized protein LOC132543866 n=1 Tax=Ylistrum balloti TaxID=509963 RepID=UPI002905DFEC|nr:uncharacterized protein LOC132543866 [Ylistrum balloti]